MTQASKQEQASARPKHPAPAGKGEHHKSRAGSKAALIALTDADLQAVTGGGGRGGIGGEVLK